MLNNEILFGMPSLIECKSLEENIILCKKLNLNFIELNMNLPQFQIDKLKTIDFNYLSKKNKIFFTLHLPEELNIADFNDKVRNAYLSTVFESIKISKKFKFPILNMHMSAGVYFKLPQEKIFLFQKYNNVYMNYINNFGIKINKLLKRNKNIKICIENTGIYNNSFITNAINNLLNYECFKLTWDIGHDHSSGNQDSEFILKNIKYLKHMHIHDAINKNNHLPLFTGEIDINSKLITARNNNCLCVIETKQIDGLEKSVEEINKIRRTTQ